MVESTVKSLTASLQNWFYTWSAERLFQRLEFPGE
jgi:hypothetical protein